MYYKKYSPFLSPPDFDLAERHYRCTLVPHPLQPSLSCPCCNQVQTFHRPSLFIKTKDLIFLGAQIPFLFYFLQVLIFIIITAVFIATGQFLACGFSDQQLCKIFKVEIDFLDYTIIIPVGFVDLSPSIEYIYAIVISAYFFFMFLIQIRLNFRYLQLSNRRLGYSDFSIMLKNVPTNTTKQDITDFMNDLDFQIKNVTLVKKTNILRKMLKYRRQVRKKLNKAVKEQNRININNQTFEWTEISSLIGKYQMNQIQTRYRTDQVFVTFKSWRDKEQFLKYYKKGIIHKLFWKCCSMCSITTIKGKHISFLDAPPPRDIIWKNLEKPFFRTRFRRFISFTFSFLVVIFGASAAFGLKSFPSSVILGITLGAIMQINNFLIVQYLNYAIKSEHYWTYTQTKVCQVNRLTFFLFLNITIVPFLLYLYGITSQQNQSQIWNQMAFSVLFISLSNIAKPFILLFDVGYLFKIINRLKQKQKGVESTLCQFQAHQLFQAPQFQIHVIYSLILSSILSTFFFLSKMPVLIIPQLVLIILIIITSRYLLTRRCKKPIHFTKKLSKSVNFIFTLCIPLFYLGHLLFKLLEQGSQFGPKFIQNIYPGLEAGLIVMYFLIINIMNIPKSVSKWMIRRNQQRNGINRPAHLFNSMNYNQSDPMLRLIDDRNDFEDMQKIPDENDIARLLETQYEI